MLPLRVKKDLFLSFFARCHLCLDYFCAYGLLFAVLDHFFGLFYIMDSDSASTPSSGKIRRCSCGRRMSGLIHDFHTVCILCRGVDCDSDHRCPECTDVTDSVIAKYVAHKLSLQRKLQCKHNKKDPAPIAAVASEPLDVAAEPAAAEPAASLVVAPFAVVSPIRVDESQDSAQGTSSEIMSQVRSLFDFKPVIGS